MGIVIGYYYNYNWVVLLRILIKKEAIKKKLQIVKYKAERAIQV